MCVPRIIIPEMKPRIIVDSRHTTKDIILCVLTIFVIRLDLIDCMRARHANMRPCAPFDCSARTSTSTFRSSSARGLLAKRRARHMRLAKFLLKKLIMELHHDAVASARPVQSAAMYAIGIEAVPLPGCAEHRARGLVVSGHVRIAEARGTEEGV